jgi:Protein of unknown function (DUF3119)
MKLTYVYLRLTMVGLLWLLSMKMADSFVMPSSHHLVFLSSSIKSSSSVNSNTSKTRVFGLLDGEIKAIGDTLSSIFSPKQPTEEVVPKLPDVVIEPSYKLPILFLTVGFVLDLIPYIQLTLGPLITLLGVLFLVQSFRIRFCFDETAFSLQTMSSEEGLQRMEENVVVGGENRWSYDSFVNWKFFPDSWVDAPQGPILAYFKETQTPSDKWNDGPGKSANSPEALAQGAVPGQVHFFPVLCNAPQLKAEFERRKCARLPE